MIVIPRSDDCGSLQVGIAPTKTLAKLANSTAKKDPTSGGVAVLLTEEAQEAALARIELTDLWGVAGRMAERLAAIGITTPLQLRDADGHRPAVWLSDR